MNTQAWTQFWRAASGRPSIAGFPKTMTLTGERQYCQPAGYAGKLLRKAGMGGCGSLSGRWLHGAEHGAPRPETDVKGHRAKANKSCDNERFIEIGPKLLADRHTDRGLLPRHGVRYIAMNDGIDTMRDNNDIAPFKNILNEMYSKDISKKVHSSYLLKAQQGQFTGCVAPLGIGKTRRTKPPAGGRGNRPIVRQIFLWALEGHGPNFIRRRLEEQKVPCPTWWNRERGFRNVRTKWEKKDPENGRYMWDFSVIKTS